MFERYDIDINPLSISVNPIDESNQESFQYGRYGDTKTVSESKSIIRPELWPQIFLRPISLFARSIPHSYPLYMPYMDKKNNTKTSIIKLRDLDLSKFKPTRGGVIVYQKFKPYGEYNKLKYKLRFCLGIDATYGQLTDFGGGIKYNRDHNVIRGAIRELSEESHDVFFNPIENKKAPIHKYKNCTVLYNENMMIIFIPLNLLSDDINSKTEELTVSQFKERKNINSEMKDIKWVSQDRFNCLIHDNYDIETDPYQKDRESIYKPIKYLIRNAGPNFIRSIAYSNNL